MDFRYIHSDLRIVFEECLNLDISDLFFWLQRTSCTKNINESTWFGRLVSTINSTNKSTMKLLPCDLIPIVFYPQS